MRGNLQEREGYVGINMVLTVPTVMLSVYFLIWQTYVLRADVIVNALLLSMYGLGGLLAFITLARFTRLESHTRAKATLYHILSYHISL